MTGVFLAVVTWDWLTVGTSGVMETVAVWSGSAAVEMPVFARCVGASFLLESWSVDFEPGLSSSRSFERKEEPGVVGTYFAAAAVAAAVVVDVAVAAAVVEEFSANVVD